MLPKLLPFLFLIAGVAQAAEHFDGNTWWDTVKVLSDDKYEGRDTGSAGERAAQEYIVGKLKSLGVEPAAKNGFYQTVELRTLQISEPESSLSLLKDGQARQLTLGEQAIFSTRFPPAPKVDAPLVFVGYGLNIPENHYNDFAGLDLTNKVAVIITGSPADVASSLSAHYQSRAERWKTLKAAGAIGLIQIPNPASMDLPWSRMALNRNHPAMDLVGAEFDETAGAKLAVTFNPAFADMLFQGTGHTFDEIAASPRSVSRCRISPWAYRSRLPASRTRKTSNPPISLRKFRGVIQNSRVSMWCSRHTSITLASASRSMAIKFTTVRWTTARAARCYWTLLAP